MSATTPTLPALGWLAAGLLAGCFRTMPPSAETAAPDTSETGDTTGESPDTSDTSDTSESLRVPLAVVSDGANSRIRYIRLDTEEVIFDHDLSEFHPERCGPGRTCIIYGIEPSVDPETGQDRLMYTYKVSADSDSGSTNLGSRLEMVQIGAAEVELLWSVSSLDFLTNFAGYDDICSSASACVSSKSAQSDRGCVMRGTHDVEILSEGADGIRLLIADTGSRPRVLMLTVDPAAPDCAVVDDIIGDATTDEWRRFENTNDADRVEYNGEEVFLVNQKASNRDIEWGQTGMGKSTLWAKRDGQWTLLDEHPPQDATSASYLNAPHNSDMVTVGDQSYVVLAHSNGNGTHFEYQIFDMETDHFGTIAVLKMDGDEMVYLYDGLLDDEEPLNFVRDVDMMDDGTFLVTDSGCNYTVDDVCTHPSSIRHLAIELDVDPPADAVKDGRWTPDQRYMEVRPLVELDTLFSSPLSCGLTIPYETDFRWTDELGPGIQARLQQPGQPCGG